MTMIAEMLDWMEDLIRNDVQNFYWEVQLSQDNRAEDFTNAVKNARRTNDGRAEARNAVESKLKEILSDKGYVVQDQPVGRVAESVAFLLDVFVINHCKVWFAEEEIRVLNKLERPNPERMRTLVNASRVANDNRIRIRKLLEYKLGGVLAGTEPLGEQDPKFFRAEARK